MPLDGLSFAGFLQPPSVPPDPIGDAWRGLVGPQGPPGANGIGITTLDSPGPIGNTTPSTGAFSQLTLSAPTFTWSDATAPRNLNAHNAWTGASSNAQGIALTRFLMNDQIAYTGSQGVNGFNIEHDYGGASFQGGRNALNVLLLQSNGANGDTGADKFYVGATSTAFARFTQPGSSATTPLGRVFGFNANSAIQAGFTATNLFQVGSAEFDVGISAGSSAYIRSGVTIADLNGTAQGFGGDNALWFYGAGAKWRNSIMWGDTQGWPVRSPFPMVPSWVVISPITAT